MKPEKTSETMTLSSSNRSVTVDADNFPVVIPGVNDFGDADYCEAPELAQQATALINLHDSFVSLANVNITYLWKKEGGHAKGKKRLGCTTKTTNLLGHFSKVDVVIWLAADHLAPDGSGITSRKRTEACLYHELCHVLADEDEAGELKISLSPHDFEGFASELEFYGTWRSDLQVAEAAFKQLGLFQKAE